MPNEAQVIMRRYQPRKYGDYWWVDIGDGVRQFNTADAARGFIRRKRDRADRCLYYGCLLEGELMAQGVGFRWFVPLLAWPWAYPPNWVYELT